MIDVERVSPWHRANLQHAFFARIGACSTCSSWDPRAHLWGDEGGAARMAAGGDDEGAKGGGGGSRARGQEVCFRQTRHVCLQIGVAETKKAWL